MADNRLDGLLRVAQEQKQAQDMMMQALQATLRSPHTITRHRIHLIAVEAAEDEMTLMIASPNGTRTDVVMDRATAAQVARGLLVPARENGVVSEAA